MTSTIFTLSSSHTLAQTDGPSFASQPTATSAPAPGATGTGATGSGGGAGGGAGGGMGNFIFLAGMGVLLAMIISSILRDRRERKRLDDMMSGIKKHDQVRTVGGIIGSVVEVKPDVVVLKVDENSGAKITVMRSKIEAVIKESATGTA